MTRCRSLTLVISPAVILIAAIIGTRTAIIIGRMDHLSKVLSQGEKVLSHQIVVSHLRPLPTRPMAHRQHHPSIASIAIDPAILRTGASRRGMVSEPIIIKGSVAKSMATLLSLSLLPAHMSTLVLLWQLPNLPRQNFQCR